jgi:pyruvate/2-oxoglutarate dehydrogenase complex dihydrolipoamide dehydrogenase (E3) component
MPNAGVRFLTPAPLRSRESDILVAAGRIPDTQGIGLEQSGVELNPRGYIRVNERLETTAPGVWAMGEWAGSPQFTHVAGNNFV